MNELADQNAQPSATSRQGANNAGNDRPAISAGDVQLLKSVEEEVIKLLANSQIDTNVFSPPEDTEAPMELRANEQNVKNRAREVRFNAHIQKYVLQVAAVLRYLYNVQAEAGRRGMGGRWNIIQCLSSVCSRGT